MLRHVDAATDEGKTVAVERDDSDAGAIRENQESVISSQ